MTGAHRGDACQGGHRMQTRRLASSAVAYAYAYAYAYGHTDTAHIGLARVVDSLLPAT